MTTAVVLLAGGAVVEGRVFEGLNLLLWVVSNRPVKSVFSMGIFDLPRGLRVAALTFIGWSFSCIFVMSGH